MSSTLSTSAGMAILPALIGGRRLGDADRRARPVILTALAAMLAFVPLTHSSFWGQLAYVLIGGVGVGTLLTLLCMPALYAIWFKVKRSPQPSHNLNQYSKEEIHA